MRFSVYILFLVISVTLLEAVPTPQSTNIKRQPWKPKAIREKEAAEAEKEAAKAAEEDSEEVEETITEAEETANEAEEATKAAEQVAEVSDQTTEVVEQTTVSSEETTAISEATTDMIKQVSAIPYETTTLVTRTTTSSGNVKVAPKHVALLEKMAFKNRPVTTPMFDNYLKVTQAERFSVPVLKVSKNRLLDNMTSNRRATVASVTGRKLIQQSLFVRTPVLTTRAPAVTKRAPSLSTRATVVSKKASTLTNRASGLTKKNAQVVEANDCRSLLRGAPCQCRVQGSCRCDCGRQTTTPQPVRSAIRFWPTRIPVRSLRLTHQFKQL